MILSELLDPGTSIPEFPRNVLGA
ncbi:hypothetical protein VULLAG_LOCUS11006 [Vulpes lagopus]